MKFNVKALKFRAPQPEILPQSGAASLLDQHVQGWTAVADTDTRIVKINVKVYDRSKGKVVPEAFHVPFEDLRWLKFLATTPKDLADAIEDDE